MLNKKRTSNAGKGKYLAFILMATSLLLLNSIETRAHSLLPDDDKIYRVCDIMPEFAGGQPALLQFLAKNIQYPVDAQQQGKQGRVIVAFVVEKDGSITGAEVLRPLFPSLDTEALRIINSMPKWTPGKMKDGKVIRVRYTVPVTYRMQ